MAPLTPLAVVVRIAVIVAAAELLIMLVLGGVPHSAGMLTEAVVDTAALVLLSTPPIWFWVIRPFVRARDAALERVSFMAFTDPLTGLANRRLLVEHLQAFMAADARHHMHGVLLLIDLDRFKALNDEHGHEAGDAVLVAVAHRLQAATRAEDVVGRLGGDEFAVLIRQLDPNERVARGLAASISDKMLEHINEPISYRGQQLTVRASIGVRLLDGAVPDMDTALRQADQAMYRAKRARGRHVAVFDDAGSGMSAAG